MIYIERDTFLLWGRLFGVYKGIFMLVQSNFVTNNLHCQLKDKICVCNYLQSTHCTVGHCNLGTSSKCQFQKLQHKMQQNLKTLGFAWHWCHKYFMLTAYASRCTPPFIKLHIHICLKPSILIQAQFQILSFSYNLLHLKRWSEGSAMVIIWHFLSAHCGYFLPCLLICFIPYE